MFAITRDAIRIFGFDIKWYGILIAAGAIIAALIAMARERKLRLPKDTAINLALICLPVGIICARAYYVIFSWDYYGAHPAEIIDIRGGGLAIYGGVIGGVIAGFIYSRIKRVSFWRMVDMVAPGLALAQAIGRWGNFLNQEAYGALVTDPAWQFFPAAVNISGEWHLATFFYESVWCALIALAIYLLERRGRLRRAGDAAFVYVMLYAFERAIVEGLRTDSLYLGGVRISQLLSILAFIASAIVLILRHTKKRSARHTNRKRG